MQEEYANYLLIAVVVLLLALSLLFSYLQTL